MQVTLEDASGKSTGRVVVSPGKRLRVGRQAPAELIVSDDFLSSLHFALDCTESRCRISDLGSRNGTFLNGARIQEAILHDGDLISAGQTKFHVRMDAGRKELPDNSRADSAAALSDKNLEQNSTPKHLLEVISPQPGEHLYALLDAARDARVLELLRSSKEQYQSLYEGQQGVDLENYAPYLVELPQDSPFLPTLLKEGWGKSWGVYLTSAKPFAEVRKHFRHFLLVQTEDGKQVYFRFYDPRVLRDFLPTCVVSESRDFFGPVRCILAEHKDASTILRFSVSEDFRREEYKLARGGV